MKAYRAAELAAELGGRLIGAGSELRICGVSADSRSVRPGELFVAIRGERYDAHAFLAQAGERGAALLCVSDLEAARRRAPGTPCWLVEDCTRHYFKLAAWYRSRLRGRLVAVSGSVGKTTTRDMIFAALSERRPAKTEANLNNAFGVAQTLFGTPEEADALVLELGIGEPGEMATLAEMARPDIACITMIGHSHLEYFGSREALAREKLELLEALRPGGLLLLNADDPVLRAAAAGERVARLCAEKAVRLAFVSLEAAPADPLPPALAGRPLLRAAEIEFGEDRSRFTLRWEGSAPPPGFAELRLELPAYGRHMIQNALFAVAAAASLGYRPAEIARGLLRFRTTGARQKRVDGRRLTLIDDSYNASPESMRAALAYVSALGLQSRRRSVAALGCVAELGGESARLHEQIGRDIARSAPDLAYVCGPWAEDMRRGFMEEAALLAPDAAPKTEFHSFAERAALSAALLPALRRRDILLVKASHSFAMEEVGKAAWRLMEESD